MNLHSSTTRKPTVLSKRISLVGLTAVATAALMFSAESASAAKLSKELQALSDALTAQGGSLNQANPDQLKAAVATATTANPKLAAKIVGEALKTQAALDSDAGAKIGEAALAYLGANPDPAALQKLIGDAAKTAGTSKNANVEQVGAFASAALSPADAAAAAKVAKASKAAVGAIYGGLAGELADDAARIQFVNTALLDKNVNPAVTEISRAVAAIPGVDAKAFAVGVASQNTKLALKIAPAVVASNPNDAREITNALLSNTALQSTLTKGAAAYAKSVAAVADVEQISAVGSLIADKIGSGAIKTSVAAGLAKTLAQAIIAKPTTATTPGNKADEIGEVAAYIVGGVLNNTAAFSVKAAPKLVLAIIKSAIAGGKASGKQAKLGLGADASYIADVVGSVARTLANATNLGDGVLTKITETLNKSAKSIAGKSNTTIVQGALTTGFANSTAAIDAGFENGTKRSLADLAAIVDPETDNKNL